MKTMDTERRGASSRKSAARTDFLFIGLAVVPPALFLSGRPELAILLFIPLLLAACLYGAWEQVEVRVEQGAKPGVLPAMKHDGMDTPGVPGLTARDRLPPGKGCGK